MKKVSKVQLRLPIFIPMATILGPVVIIGRISPKALFDGENTIVSYAVSSFGWLFQLSSVVFFFICLRAMFSKFGNIRLGGKDAKPTMSKWNWFAISLCAGIATGILFWGIAYAGSLRHPLVFSLRRRSDQPSTWRRRHLGSNPTGWS